MKRHLYAEVASGGLIPSRLLGLAYYVYDRDAAVYLVMPLNQIVRWARSLYWFIRFPDPSAWDNRYATIRTDALGKAYQRGYDAGHRAGFVEGEQAMLGTIREQVRGAFA